MKKISGKDVALSGVSAGFAVIAILFAIYLKTLTIAFYTISALSISLPLIKERVLSCILSYIAASIVGFILVSINILPFILFFGLYVIIQWFLDFKFYTYEKLSNKTKIVLIIILKWIYFIGMFFACYFLMNIVIEDLVLFNLSWSLPLLLFSAFVVFSIYDIVYRETFKFLKRKLINKI